MKGSSNQLQEVQRAVGWCETVFWSANSPLSCQSELQVTLAGFEPLFVLYLALSGQSVFCSVNKSGTAEASLSSLNEMKGFYFFPTKFLKGGNENGEI